MPRRDARPALARRMLEPWWAIPARRAGLAAGAAVGADDGLAAAGEVNAVDDRDVAAGAAVDHVAL